YGGYGFSGPLLMKWIFQDGKIKTCYTNGVELKSSPNDCINDLTTILTKLIYSDIDDNRALYFYASKTDAEVKQEWNSVK
ncbi:MAG: hypothetical protein ACRCYO_03520, partial [Bacteroidia bacterium]